jgi:hypothetical protein
MERRTVRIYKAPNGQGEYINKTKKFLQKAQMGAETTSENVMAQKQMEALMQYVTGALNNDMEPEEVYKLLISKGIPKEIAYPILTQAMQEMEAPEEEEQPEGEEATEEEAKIGQSEYKPVEEEPVEEEEESNPAMDHYNSYANEEEPDVIANSEAEYQDGGIISYDQLNADSEEDPYSSLEQKLATLANFVQTNANNQDNFSDFGKDISEYAADYNPIEWDKLGDNYGYYKKGGSKKNFTKNVLALIKKQEGGDNAEPADIGKGNKKDTLTNDVSKIKNQFTDKLKQVASKAAVDSIYEKMMKSNNPELMQQAQELASNRQKNSQMGTFEPVAQQGGYIGENQPDMFNYGGFDMPQAQKGFIQKAGDFLLGEQYLTANNPYDVKTGALYRDPLSGLTPVARTVHKRGILGRPKKWTDYYSKGLINQVPNTPGQEIKAAYEKATTTKKDEKKLIHGYPEEVWNELPGNVRRAIKRGERRVKRRRDYEDEKDLTIEELIALEKQERKKQNDKAYKERKDAIEKDNKRLEEEKKLERVNDPDRKKADWETVNDRINNKLEKYTEEQYEKFDKESKKPKKPGLLEAIKAESDKINSQRIASEMGYGVDYQNILDMSSDPNNPNEQKANLAKDLLNQYTTAAENAGYDISDILKNYIPADDRNTVSPGIFQFTPGKSKMRAKEEELIEAEMEREREAEEWEKSMIKNNRKQLGGLPKAQIGVKSPTNNLSPASDPTANTSMIPGTGPLMPSPKPKTAEWHAPMLAPEDKQSPVPEAFREGYSINPYKTDQPEEDTDQLIGQDVQRRRRFDGTKFDNKSNATFDITSNALRGLDSAKQSEEMYQNNYNANKIYGVSTDKDRGDYVAYGQQTGMFRPNETGQETSGRFSVQKGGYMQDGGQSRQEILKEFTSTPEFKKGLDLMMQRENTDNTDPFLDAMFNAKYSAKDAHKYGVAMGGMNEDWEKIVPQKSPYTKSGRHREYQDLMNKAYGSERYNTPYAPGGGGPRREDEQYFPTAERRPTPFEDGRVDPRTLEAIQPVPNEDEDMQIGGYMEEGGYVEGDEVDMTEEELREFIANGGEVEYL